MKKRRGGRRHVSVCGIVVIVTEQAEEKKAANQIVGAAEVMHWYI